MKLKIISGICLLLAVLIWSCQSEQAIEFDRYYSSGMGVYQTHCLNCHGAEGQGLAQLIPPLTDTVLLKKNKNSLPCIIKNGLINKITVSGKLYDGTMPPVALSPIEIAQVLTYVGNSFGNKLGLVNTDDVIAYVNNCKN